jgi:hypothetical protein
MVFLADAHGGMKEKAAFPNDVERSILRPPMRHGSVAPHPSVIEATEAHIA